MCKAISLWQPWASLWLSDAKVHETRDWAIRHRGPLLVHATKRFMRNNLAPELVEILEDEFGGHWGMDLPTGALIGVVEITGCYEIGSQPWLIAADDRDFHCGNWSPGRYAWRRTDTFRVFPRPIPWRGMQAPFEVPDTVVAPFLTEAAA